MTQSPHYNHGKSKKIALVFSCPGQEEDKLGRPTAGQTGENLNTFLAKLTNNLTVDRYDYRITNAYDKVFYQSKDGRTEATTAEILSSENIQRLANEVSDIDYIIIAFGNKAKMALDEVQKTTVLKAKVIQTKHLGLQAINRMSVHNPNGLSGNDLKNYKIGILVDEVKKYVVNPF